MTAPITLDRMALNAVYIAPQGCRYAVCRGDRVIRVCNSFFEAWQAREAERKAAR